VHICSQPIPPLYNISQISTTVKHCQNVLLTEGLPRRHTVQSKFTIYVRLHAAELTSVFPPVTRSTANKSDLILENLQPKDIHAVLVFYIEGVRLKVRAEETNHIKESS
jgi:hypothetical protein